MIALLDNTVMSNFALVERPDLLRTTFGGRAATPQQAFRELLAAFTCPDCNEYLRVSPDRETPESLRCDCGRTEISLCKKNAQ